MIKNKIKAALLYAIVFSAVIPLVLSTMTFADVSGKKPSELASISFFRDAINTCIKGIDTSTLNTFINNDGDVAYRAQQEKELYNKLANGQIFGTDGAPYVYSDTLAKLTNRSGGEISCGGNGNSLVNNAFNTWGVPTDFGVFKGLYCDGTKPGVLRILQSPVSEVDADMPDLTGVSRINDDSDCSGSFELLGGYGEGRSRGFVVWVDNTATGTTANYPLNPSSHFGNWFTSKVGDLSQTEASQTGALKYAKAAMNFTQLCTASGSGPFTEDPKAGDRAVQIYDGFSSKVRADQKVWYVIPDNISLDQTFMTNITNNAGSTCKEMAAALQNADEAQAYGRLEGTIDENGDPTNQNGLTAITGDAETPGPVSDTIEDACYDSGIVSMGWLVCPTISNGANTIDPIEGMIKDMLQVQTGLYGVEGENGQQSATYIAWNIIRNIANVVLVILFLVIIFSQITGYGIDNYGIKKLLPKLIVSAVIINLSYIICEVVIDISNILGQGLCSLFQNIAGQIGATVDVNSGSEIIVGLVAALFGATAEMGMFSSTIVSAVNGSSDNGMVAIIVGLALLLALIAVIIFFVMLGARMVIIVGCVAIAPVAFACNLLPNTQGLFKKWWKVMEACLIIYPICGAVYGLSAVIRAIIFSTGNEIHFWEGIVAIIAPFLPFFFLPTLLKSAINGLGVVGGALLGITSGAKGGLESGINAIQNSDRFQRRAQFAKDQTAGLRAQRTIDKLSKKNEANGGTANDLKGLKDNEKRRLMEATSQQQAYQQQQRAINRSTDAYRGALDQNLADKAKEEDIAVFASQIANDADLANNMDRRKEELQRELMKTNQDEASTARAAALYRSLAADGKKGFDAIGDVFDSGNLKGGSALSQVLSEIKGNMDIKDKAPSLYNVANRLRTTSQENLSAELAKANQVAEERKNGNTTGTLKGSQIPGLTEKEFQAHVDNTSAAAANATFGAISNSDAYSQMTVDQQQQAVNQVANYMAGDNASAEEAYNFLNNSNAAAYVGNVDDGQLAAIQAKANAYNSPEQQRHNEQMSAIQNQTWTAHQNAQQQAGPNAQGVYQAPQGFRADLSNPDIFRDNQGNVYNVRTNTFTPHS